MKILNIQILAKFLLAKCPLAKCPLAKCPLAKCPDTHDNMWDKESMIIESMTYR